MTTKRTSPTKRTIRRRRKESSVIARIVGQHRKWISHILLIVLFIVLVVSASEAYKNKLEVSAAIAEVFNLGILLFGRSE